MQKSYKDFIKEIKNKSILFCGLGRSNLPLIKMLTNEKISITAYDSKREEKFPSEVIKELKSNNLVNLRLSDESVFDEFFDIVIRTPGISFFSEKIARLKSKGSYITSEMEIFFDLCPCKIIGITGSDGKTTTTTIISEILKRSGKTVHLGGNIGKPLLPTIEKIGKDDIAVIELSSFQLMSMRKSPEIAVVTNISPNHLDYHKDMNEYIDCKKQILKHQTAFSKTILNFDNEKTREMAAEVRGKLIFFSRKSRLENGVWVDEKENIIFSQNGRDTTVLNSADIKIPGKHNLENYLAAIACVLGLVKTEYIKETAENFGGVEHRMEFVGKFGGVSYYNDSIASTPTRTINGALSLFEKKVILIAGGYDKKVPFGDLAKEALEKVSSLILMGNTAEKIKSEVEKQPNYNSEKLKIHMVENMKEAVLKADEITKTSDIVILSPACASFDLYRNFEERGNDFKSEVKDLIIKKEN